MLTVTTAASAAETPNEGYTFGWQYSRPVNGISVKVPIYQDYFLQPVVSLNISEDDHLADGRYSAGLRFFANLPERGDFQPYAGISAGHFKTYQKTDELTTESISGNGYEAFFGVEYQKYIIRPSIEIGMGSYIKKNGDYYAGLSVNAGVAYFF
jgi:hypothetical protein